MNDTDIIDLGYVRSGFLFDLEYSSISWWRYLVAIIVQYIFLASISSSAKTLLKLISRTQDFHRLTLIKARSHQAQQPGLPTNKLSSHLSQHQTMIKSHNKLEHPTAKTII